MTIPAYPATLPAPAEYAFTPRERRRTQQQLGGLGQFRTFAREAVVDAQVSWRLPADALAAFREWFDDTLDGGALRFTMKLPGSGGLVSRSARFVSPLQLQHLTLNIYDVSATLEVRG